MREGPAIGPLRFAFQRSHGEPVDRPFHRVLAGNDFAVVLLHGLAGPTEAARFLGEVHIHEAKILFLEKES